MKFKKLFSRGRKRLLNQAAFLARLSVLLKEGYIFYEAIYLILPHHMKEYTEVLSEIEADFRGGLSATDILSRLGYSKSVLLPIVIAEKEGSLPKALGVLAKRLEKTERAKRKVRSLIAYPAVLFIFITILLVGFRNFFLPNLENLVQSRVNQDTGIVSMLPMLVAKLPDLILGCSLLVLVLLISGAFFYQKLSAVQKIRFFLMIPVIRTLFMMIKTRLFTNEIGSLLDAGFSLQDALGILKEQELDDVLSEISANIKEQVIYGEPFYMAVSMTDGLTRQLSSFAEHGENSGHLPRELLIYSDHLDDEINHRLEKGLALLQPLLFSLVAVCILAAYLAILLPVYGMLNDF